MATIVTRAGKGSPLTHAEVDANFNNLNADKAETSALGTAAFTAATDYATAAQGTNADTAFGWGDHAAAGYLTGYTETDPIYTASTWYTTTNNSANWDAAYAWGDHALAGYLTSYTETDPIYTASTWYTTTNNSANWDAAYAWGDHAAAGYTDEALALAIALG